MQGPPPTLSGIPYTIYLDDSLNDLDVALIAQNFAYLNPCRLLHDLFVTQRLRKNSGNKQIFLLVHAGWRLSAHVERTGKHLKKQESTYD